MKQINPCEEYQFKGRQFAKGFSNAKEALGLDPGLSASVEAKVEVAIAREGSKAVIDRLAVAKAQAASVVPKDHVAEFQMGIDEACSEMERRLESARPTQAASTRGEV